MKHQQHALSADAPLARAMEVLNAHTPQIVVVVAPGAVLGTVTDGDVRRALLRGATLDTPVREIMNGRPTLAAVGSSRHELIALMLAHEIRQVPLVSHEGAYVGLVALDELHVESRPHHAVVMAGGLGTRLGPLTAQTPKPMLTVGDRPLLETLVRQLRGHGFTRITIAVNYLADRITSHFGDGSHLGVSIDYLHEESPMGTAGALSLLPHLPSQPLLVMNGDILTQMNVRAFVDFHLSTGAAVTVGVRTYAHQVPYGVVNTKGVMVTSLVEKPRYDFFVNAGLYVIEPSTLAGLPPGRCDMTDVIDRVLETDSGRVAAYPIHEYWRDIGRPSDLHEAHEEYRSVFGGEPSALERRESPA